MDIIKITKKHKEEVLGLFVEEDKFMNQFMKFPIYKTKLDKKKFYVIFNQYLSKDKFFLGVKDNNKLVGIVMGDIKKLDSGRIGFLDNIFILKKYRNQGIGRDLKDKFFAWLRKKRVKYCYIMMLSSNKDAFEIYKSWGFEVDGYRLTKKISKWFVDKIQ